MAFPYDHRADALLKELGAALHEITASLICGRAPDPHRQADTDAIAIMREAVGFDPSGSGPNRVRDPQIHAAIPRTEGMLRLATSYAQAPRSSQRWLRRT